MVSSLGPWVDKALPHKDRLSSTTGPVTFSVDPWTGTGSNTRRTGEHLSCSHNRSLTKPPLLRSECYVLHVKNTTRERKILIGTALLLTFCTTTNETSTWCHRRLPHILGPLPNPPPLNYVSD